MHEPSKNLEINFYLETFCEKPKYETKKNVKGSQKRYTHQLSNKAFTVLELAIICHRYEISAYLSHHSVKAQRQRKNETPGTWNS